MLDDLRQEGCLKVRFPRTERAAWPGAVLLNTAGGIAGGDRLSSTIHAGPGTAATLTTQAAERYYRALPGSYAAVTTKLTVADGAALEWLPQETILFNGCALRRELRVTLAEHAWFLGLEQLVFGRTAMQERVVEASIRDLIHIERHGRPLLHDAIRFEGPVQEILDRPASANGGRAVATMVLVADNGADLVMALRTALTPWDAGVSAWDGMVVARIVAENGACLRAATVAGLGALRAGRPLPRVWEC